MEFNIRIFNGANCEIYNEIIEAKDENKAMLKVLDNVILYTDDKIIIE